jgi:hypothetical protein
MMWQSTMREMVRSLILIRSANALPCGTDVPRFHFVSQQKIFKMIFSALVLSTLMPYCLGHVSNLFDQDTYPPQDVRPKKGPSLRHTNDFVSTFDFHRKFLKNKGDIPHAFHDDDEDDDDTTVNDKDKWGQPGANDDSANPKYEWKAPDLTTQSRAPCPMLNTLANHGMLPRDGKNITADMFADVLKKHLNLERSFWWIVANTTIEVVKPFQTAIDLEDIKKHNGNISYF